MTKKQKQTTPQGEHAEEVVFEEEVATKSTFGGGDVAKLKKQLKECQKEKKEYLDGWQRLKADVANAKKEEGAKQKRAEERGVEKLLTELAPVLDSFDMAFRGEAWEKVDATWRAGIEYIHTHLEGALTNNGVSIFGAAGERFDPKLHEASSEKETDDKTKDHTLASVSRRGYKLGERVIRPAQVEVFVYKK